MNKYIGILLLILLSSCNDDYCTQHYRTYNVNNNLHSKFIFYIHTDISDKYIYVGGHDTNMSIIEKEHCRKSGFINAHFGDDDYIYEYCFSIYNISDTSSYNLEYYIYDEKSDSIFKEHLYFSDKETTNLRVVDTLSLTIDSTLLPIFKKDYNMLEQFKEYYE